MHRSSRNDNLGRIEFLQWGWYIAEQRRWAVVRTRGTVITKLGTVILPVVTILAPGRTSRFVAVRSLRRTVLRGLDYGLIRDSPGSHESTRTYGIAAVLVNIRRRHETTPVGIAYGAAFGLETDGLSRGSADRDVALRAATHVHWWAKFWEWQR